MNELFVLLRANHPKATEPAVGGMPMAEFRHLSGMLDT